MDTSEAKALLVDEFAQTSANHRGQARCVAKEERWLASFLGSLTKRSACWLRS